MRTEITEIADHQLRALLRGLDIDNEKDDRILGYLVAVSSLTGIHPRGLVKLYSPDLLRNTPEDQYTQNRKPKRTKTMCEKYIDENGVKRYER